MTIRTVKDIPEHYQLITNSQDIEGILDGIGFYDISEYLDEDEFPEYGCLFVNADNGEYLDVYGCEYTVPHLSYDVDQLL